MCTSSELVKINQKVIELYNKICGDSLDRIYLYGSYARGDNNSQSDIDYAAIMHGSREDVQKYLKPLWEAVDDIDIEYAVIVSPTIIPYDDFYGMQDVLPYYRNIMKEGVLLSGNK